MTALRPTQPLGIVPNAVAPRRARKLMGRIAVASALMAVLATAVVSLTTEAGVAAFGALFFGVLGTRLVLWWRYRPVALTEAERQALPTLTVVIPAYNEGEMVRRSIESVLASEYPRERLKVIVVNDGSKDDTGAHIDAVARRYPGRVRAIHLTRNQGKRHALYTGLSQAESEYVATVDSDSIVPRRSLANLLAPMIRDRKISGVAGKVMVHNRTRNLLTRMLGVRYVLGFDLIRAYQSELRTVWCCPGALQGYRLSTIRPHLSAWRDQTFMGAPCTNGDDHAMTNLVLSLGADTAYQSNAVVETLVPTRYKQLCKMYIRWGRSATREGIRALGFAGERALEAGPIRGMLMLLDAVMQPVTILLRLVGLVAALVMLFIAPLSILAGLGATLLVAAIYCLVYLRSDRSMEALYGVAYALYALFLLPWVQPYATLTVRKNKWMTRG